MIESHNQPTDRNGGSSDVTTTMAECTKVGLVDE